MSKVIFLVALLLISAHYIKAQASIGQTEEEIRKEYSGNPNADIHEEFKNGEKNIIVVDQDAIASFGISESTKLCYRSLFQFKNPNMLPGLVSKFDANYEVITQGKAWRTTLNGHIIKLEIRHSEKLQSDLLLAYNIN